MKTCCQIKLLRERISPSQTQCRICKANHYQLDCEFGLVTAALPNKDVE